MDEQKLMATITPQLTAELLSSIASAKRIKVKEDLPTGPGHYIIMCNKDVPSTADICNDNYKTLDKYFWYNGTCANSLKSRLSDHLFRDVTKRRQTGVSNGLRVHQCDISDLSNGSSQNFKKVSGTTVYELGIDITESQWKDHEFYVATINSTQLSGMLETTLRNEIVTPALCKCKVR